MAFSKLKTTLVAAVLLLAAAGAAALVLNTLLQNPSVQRYLLAQVSKETGADVTAADMAISLWGEPGVVLQDVQVSTPESAQSFSAVTVQVGLAPSRLLQGQIDVDELVVMQPRITLSSRKTDAAQSPDNGTTVQAAVERALAMIRSVRVREGEIDFTDGPYALRSVALDVQRGAAGRVTISAAGRVIPGPGGPSGIPITLSGSLQPNARGQIDRFEAQVGIGEVLLSGVPWLETLQAGGRATLSAKISGALAGPVTAEGTAFANGFRFVLSKDGQSKTYSQPRLDLDFAARTSSKRVDLSRLQVRGPDFVLQTRASLDYSNPSVPRLDLEASAAPMPLETFKAIFPAPLLPPWVAQELLPLLSGGQAGLEHLRLKGTLAEIQNLGRPENAKALFMSVGLKDVEVFKSTGALPLTGVAAAVSYDDQSLRVSGVSADFGTSRLRNGSFSIEDLFAEAPLQQYAAEAVMDLADIPLLAKNSRTPEAFRRLIQQCTHLSGRLEARLQAEHNPAWPWPRIKQSDLSLKNSLIAHPELILPLSLESVTLKVDEAGKAKLDGAGLWGKSRFRTDLSGARPPGNSVPFSGKLNLNLDCIDLNEILGARAANRPGDIRAGRPPLTSKANIRLHLSAEKGRWKNFELGRIQATGAFRDTALFIDQCTIPLDGGRVSLKGHLKPAETLITANLQLTRTPAKTLLEGLDLQLDLLEADVTAQGAFTVKGSGGQAPGITGTLDLLMEQGRFGESSVFFKILNLMNFRNIMKKRNADQLNRGLRFESIQGRADIDSGTLTLHDYHMKTSLFNATGEGTVALNEAGYPTRGLIGIEPLGKITDLADKIPLSGYVLNDGTKSLLTYYFELNGPLSNPAVKHLTPGKLSKGTLGLFKDLFLKPGRVLNGLLRGNSRQKTPQTKTEKDR